MAISSLGVGSGLDLETLVTGLLNAERRPAEGRLNLKQSRAQTQLSALGALKSAASTLTTAINALKDFETELKAGSSDSDVVTVALDGDPSPAGYQVQVQQLAAAQSLASETFDDLDAALGEGTLTLTVGESVVAIELTADANSLADVRDAINQSDAGVQAAIVRDGDSYRLLLTSAQTGLAGGMTVTIDGTIDPRLSSAQLTETVAASDAAFTVNGLALTSSGNTIEDVVSGVTLTLKQRTEDGESIAVTIEPDRAGARKKIEALVTAYNALSSGLRQAGRSSAEAAGRGPLVGDSTVRALESRLGTAFSSTVELGEAGAGTSFERLADIGLQRGIDGKAVLDAARLEEALAEDEAGVDALLSAFAAGFGATLEAYSGSGGLIENRTKGLDGDLRRISEQREALTRRMDQVEARLRAQFSALDMMLAQFQSTSEYLAGQLAGLANLRPKE